MPGFLLLLMTIAAEPGNVPLRIGLYDQQAAGGQGASVAGLVEPLRAMGYEVERFTSLTPLSLLPYDIVYLSDMHDPGLTEPDWRDHLASFVRSGGSVLQTWHHHVLGEVGVGIQRSYGSRRMQPVPGHPAVEGLAEFDASFGDHIYERLGPLATPLLKNSAGEVVAAAGELGRGKVISCGLALAIPDGNRAQAPRGGESALLAAFLRWLAPALPTSERRAAVLSQPRLELSATRLRVAAGRPARWEVRAAGPGVEAPRIACQGGAVTALAPGDTPVHRYRCELPTEEGADSERVVEVEARWPEATLKRQITVAARFSPAPAGERRGVWLHVAPEKEPARVYPELKRLGIGFVALRSAGGLTAWYGGSKVQPHIDDPYAPGRDWLAESVKEGHAQGIEVHAYVNNLVAEGRAPAATLKELREAGRLQVGPGGEPIDWLCPSSEANRAHVEAVMVELASRYQVDGVQYDFIRYPDRRGCFCPRCREAFEQAAGAVAVWPADLLAGGPRHAAWVEFRCEQISSLVKAVSTAVRAAAPRARISAAVFADWPNCRVDQGQDWPRWCREGWLDFVCPMNYTLNPNVFEARAKLHREVLPAGFPMVQGIGIAAGTGDMASADELALQIVLARGVGAAGWIGFAYRPKHTAELMEPLTDWLAAR